MKKKQLKNQIRKIATRDAIEKRKSKKPVDPFLIMLDKSKTHKTSKHSRYNNEEDDDYETY